MFEFEPKWVQNDPVMVPDVVPVIATAGDGIGELNGRVPPTAAVVVSFSVPPRRLPSASV